MCVLDYSQYCEMVAWNERVVVFLNSDRGQDVNREEGRGRVRGRKSDGGGEREGGRDGG